jgi:hypothetical protein
MVEPAMDEVLASVKLRPPVPVRENAGLAPVEMPKPGFVVTVGGVPFRFWVVSPPAAAPEHV